MHFSGPFSFDFLAEREWLLTNGLGGYASATLCGMNTRRYHGLLVAALHPPGGRTLLVAKLEETNSPSTDGHIAWPPINIRTRIIRWGISICNRSPWKATASSRASPPAAPSIEKQVSMVPGENTTCVRYRNTGTLPFLLALTPLVNARDFHGETAPKEHLSFPSPARAGHVARRCMCCRDWMADGFWLYADNGSWTDAPDWYYNMTYCWERRRGLTAVDNHFSPGHFNVTLPPGEEITITLALALPPALAPPPAEQPVKLTSTGANLARRAPRGQFAGWRAGRKKSRSSCAPRTPSWSNAPAWAGSNRSRAYGDRRLPLVRRLGTRHHDRAAGIMLAARGRYADAAEILRTFAAARRRGLLPNLFLDSGEGEAYNTVDASLWFVYAVDRYYHATQDRALIEELRPALEEIIHYYRQGTDFGIGMDRDGLIIASAPGWQLTWMDAKVGDWVVTPRMGKPVEINALWYNALRVMEAFAHAFGWPGDYGKLAERVRKSFAAFWYAQGGYLYDVLQRDARCPPAPEPDLRRQLAALAAG